MFDTFEEQLHEALVHLYDPAYRGPELLCRRLGSCSELDSSAIRETIVESIAQLEPGEEVPPNARIRRIYQLLSCRYLQEMTQEETAAVLGISPRHLRREQQQALRALAQRLWERSSETESEKPASHDADYSESDWRTQVRQELDSLEQCDPGAVADVHVVTGDVLELVQRMADSIGVNIAANLDEGRLVAKIHPSLLRQILIVAIQQLLQHMRSGEIRLAAQVESEEVVIVISGSHLCGSVMPESEFIHETVILQDGTFEQSGHGDRPTFRISLPCEEQLTILIVDDNADLVHFFQRFAARTRYHLIHVDRGRAALAAIDEIRPAVIVLDVMLPDIDGWEMLTRLRADPATRSIPVIVCSVVRQEELALSLGATGYVLKPVRRLEFLKALDEALAQAAEADPPDPKRIASSSR